MADEAKAANVIEALTRVMRDLPAIGKDGQASAQQGGYAYRGIEQITKEAQGLFARHGVVFTPHVRSYEVRDLIINNKPWTDVYETVEYTVYGPGGIDDRIVVGPILAIGRDNSDKGGNKCLTQAYKYALIQTLTISDAKDDGDSQTHEADARPAAAPPVPNGWESWDGLNGTFTALKTATEAIPDEADRSDVVAWVKAQGITKLNLTPAQAAEWERLLPVEQEPAQDVDPTGKLAYDDAVRAS